MRAVWLMLLLSLPGGEGVSVEVPRMVNGTVGSPVVLPCNFTSPYTGYTTFKITVIWKVKEFYRGPVLFNVTSRAINEEGFENVVHSNVNGRYRLAGDPRQSDASLELRSATLEDTSQYFCRVEVKRQGLSPYMKETNPGIILKITGPPTILNMYIQAINATQFTLVCLVGGEPAPNIAWIDPQNQSLPVNGSNTPVMRGPGKYQVVGELHGPKLGGNYTCKATNSRGDVTHKIYFAGVTEDRALLKVIIGALCGSLLLIIAIVVGLVMWRRKSGSITFVRETRNQPDSSKYVY
ncbi:sialic acid-binding Ig-like lectin 15 [Scyliorhinus canicula]|uniref:sialic acid-binding Ig-like lectin 15 n=1 Tax=Scyliorhinus canicula TaxID=7830 RepID=UPI0018F39E03|nr:sialic acid-binding Ig-like lectin 15 [Scyliorhinus canicula]